MARRAHLSVRVSPAEKATLERLAAEHDLTVGQLVRRALKNVAGRPDAASSRPRRAGATGRGSRMPSIRRTRELRWLAEHAEELAGYAGEWIILDGDELVAHAPDFLQALAEARRRGVRVPFVERIPSDQPAAGSSMGL
jgi:hypothetical protein